LPGEEVRLLKLKLNFSIPYLKEFLNGQEENMNFSLIIFLLLDVYIIQGGPEKNSVNHSII